MKWMNILISIDDAYVIHAKDLIITLSENNKRTKFNIYLIYDDTLSKESINELDEFIKKLDCGILKTYYFNGEKNKFPMHIDYITQNTYYRLFAPYIIDDKIDRILYLDCDIICNGDISEFYNQDFENNILVGCENQVPNFFKHRFKEMTPYLNFQGNGNYINAGVLLMNVKLYKDFISSDSIFEYIEEHKNEFIFQDQDVINLLFKDNIKISNIIYNYQINAIDYGIDMKNCRLVHYSELRKPWNTMNPNFKKYLHYYKYLYTHNRKVELKTLLQSQYNDSDYCYDYVSKLNKSFNEIDIIIPVYNSKKYLSKALDSILSQTFKDIKIYIVDDCSSEDYMDILSKYNTLDIFYLKLDNNLGPGVARKIGLEQSYGNYVIFLDSDDVFYDDKSIEILYKAIEDADVVTSKIYEESEKQVFENDNIGLHGKIYKREFLEKFNITFSDARLNEDSFFNALCELYGAHYNNISDFTYIWCDNPNSITRQHKEEHINNDILSYCSAILNAINYYLNNNESINYESLFPYLAKAIIINAEKYRICAFEIKEDVLENLSQLIYIFKEYNSIENIVNYLIDSNLKELYEINKDIILEVAEIKIRVLNYNNENKEEKYSRVYLVEEYNKTSVYDQEKRMNLIRQMFNKVEETCIIEPPFHACWGGKNVRLGNGVYISFNCTMIDDGIIEIGNNTFIGPNVTINTTNHPLEVIDRLNGILYVSNVKIGNNVWIGAGTLILPGVTIGDNTVIGAGSLVSNDIPDNVLAYGNPCRIIKNIDN